MLSESYLTTFDWIHIEACVPPRLLAHRPTVPRAASGGRTRPEGRRGNRAGPPWRQDESSRPGSRLRSTSFTPAGT